MSAELDLLADNLYRAGWQAHMHEEDYDPRGTEAWAAVRAHLLARVTAVDDVAWFAACGERDRLAAKVRAYFERQHSADPCERDLITDLRDELLDELENERPALLESEKDTR